MKESIRNRFIVLASCILVFLMMQGHSLAGLGVPRNSKPGKSRSSASRSPEGFKGFIFLLVPALPDARKPATFLTHRTDPIIYWFLSKSTDLDLLISLHEYGEARRPKQVGGKGFVGVLKGQKQPGIHAIDLAKAFGKKVELKPDVKYEIRIAIVREKRQTSTDPVSMGCIEYRPISKQLKSKLANDDSANLDILAENGYWFSVLEKLEAETNAARRADVLKEGNLVAVALSERLRLKPSDSPIRAQLEDALKQLKLIEKLPSERIDLPK